VSPAENGLEPGTRFLSEIREQPAALRRLLEHDGEIAPTPALLSPLLSVVPGQLFGWALARARGLDPDAPHGLA
jgi:fructoselysine-6-P-deglycase FrlB-like protein